jgi:hypothetical protein
MHERLARDVAGSNPNGALAAGVDAWGQRWGRLGFVAVIVEKRIVDHHPPEDGLVSATHQ